MLTSLIFRLLSQPQHNPHPQLTHTYPSAPSTNADDRRHRNVDNQRQRPCDRVTSLAIITECT